MAVKIAPSILASDFTRLGEEVARAEEAGASLIHIDVMDGHFVSNLTVGPPIVAALKKATPLPLDVHLMIEEPDKFIDDFAKAGASFITVHAETGYHLHRTLNFIKEKGCRAGIALNPATPVDNIKLVLEEADLVLIMSVNPGFGGQEFIPFSLPKISQVKKLSGSLGKDIEIEVDGGITLDNVQDVVKAGATILVMGTTIFKARSIKETMAQLKRKIKDV
jgi:ribulose-phosphate 3-epimerase